MTNLSKPSHHLWKLFFILIGFLSACAKPSSQQHFSSASISSQYSAGVIGGEPVQASAEYANKVLYLATGVRTQQDPRTGTRIGWTGHCTAAAISPKVILTAAHCVEGQRLDQLRIVLTKDPAKKALVPNEWYSVKAVRVHEQYGGKQNGFLNDLALILLTRDVPASRVLKMAEPEFLEFPLDFMVIGYGTTSASSDPQETGKNSSLMNSVMKIVEEFNLNSKTFSINQNDHKGFCSGDSGGPGLVYDPESHEYMILGVVSNVSMMDAERAQLDPQRKFSLCIGQGNYVNIVNPDLRGWIDENHASLIAAL